MCAFTWNGKCFLFGIIISVFDYIFPFKLSCDFNSFIVSCPMPWSLFQLWERTTFGQIGNLCRSTYFNSLLAKPVIMLDDRYALTELWGSHKTSFVSWAAVFFKKVNLVQIKIPFWPKYFSESITFYLLFDFIMSNNV